jgi:hypothetical protein
LSLYLNQNHATNFQKEVVKRCCHPIGRFAIVDSICSEDVWFGLFKDVLLQSNASCEAVMKKPPANSPAKAQDCSGDDCPCDEN